ncbi:hypothetical protein ACJJTC_013341 [Scirpophaga incertulas]
MLQKKQQTRFEVNKQHQKEILDQAKDIAERNRMEYEAELNLQKIDNIKAAEEIKALKKFEEEFKAAEKQRIWADMQRSRDETAALRRERASRDALDDRLIGVLTRTTDLMQRRRKETELAIKQEKLRVLEKISQKLESGDAAREAKEQAVLDKAIKEKEAIPYRYPATGRKGPARLNGNPPGQSGRAPEFLPASGTCARRRATRS